MQLFQPWQVKQVLEVANHEYEGRPTIRITFGTQNRARWVTHVDRTTYQHIYSQYDWMFYAFNRGLVTGKTFEKTEYRAEGGRLWPTRFERYQVPSGGKKEPLTEITFVEYTPYTPTADELDIEKQFGVKPIPHEPRPEPAPPKQPPESSGEADWMFWVAGLLALAALVVLALRSRRPTTTTGVGPPA